MWKTAYVNGDQDDEAVGTDGERTIFVFCKLQLSQIFSGGPMVKTLLPLQGVGG